MICQFLNLHTEVGRKVGCLSPGFAPPQCFNAGIMTDYACEEGSTYKSNVKLIEMPTSTLFLETVENKMDSSEISSELQIRVTLVLVPALHTYYL